jgi:hypothetical protein
MAAGAVPILSADGLQRGSKTAAIWFLAPHLAAPVMMAIAYLKVRTSQRSKNLYFWIERAKHKTDPRREGH